LLMVACLILGRNAPSPYDIARVVPDAVGKLISPSEH